MLRRLRLFLVLIPLLAISVPPRICAHGDHFCTKAHGRQLRWA